MGKVAGGAGRARRTPAQAAGASGIVNANRLDERQMSLRNRAIIAAAMTTGPAARNDTRADRAYWNRVVQQGRQAGVITDTELRRVRRMPIQGESKLNQDIQRNATGGDRLWRFRTNLGGTINVAGTGRYVASDARRFAVQQGATDMEYIGVR